MPRTDRSKADDPSRDAYSGRDDLDAVDVVPTAGFVVAAIAIVGPLLSLRRGVTDPAIVAATACTGLAALAFLGRRHGALERSIGSPVAAIASGFAVVLTGYAIAIGVTDSVSLPGVGWSVSLVFGSFVAAGVAVGIAVADYAGVSGSGLKRRGARFLEMLVVGFLGLLSTSVVWVVLAIPVFLLVGDLTEVQETGLSYVAFGTGLGAVAVGYLAFTERGLSYVDLEVPTLRTVVWTIAGVLAVLGLNFALSLVLAATGVESAGHSTVENVEQNLELLVVVVPAMLLIVGPGEELLYRNVVQKTLYETFSRSGAIVVASAIFATVHVSAYATAGSGRVLVSLTVVFGLSLVLGTIYERTENLVVPAIVHGTYNAIVFATLLL